MSMIKVVTDKKHRFGQSLDISGKKISINSEGIAEVEEEMVPYVLVYGFELVDKSQAFDSVEQLGVKDKIELILTDAKTQANQIILEAETKAAEIVADANAKAGIILIENQVDEKKVYRDNLEKLTIDNLKEELSAAKVPEEQYKGKKKAELIDLIFSLAFSEE